MDDRDPLFDLPDLAAYAEDHATPPPPDRIRARGARRRRRRHVGVAAATTVAVLIGGGAVFAQSGLLSDQDPDPAPQPRVTAVPSVPGVDASLTAANLPTSFDLELNYPKQWLEGDTVTGSTPIPVSRCFTAGLATLGAQTILSRTYTLAKSPDDTAAAVALELADEAAAKEAYQTIEQAVEDCPATLTKAGYDRTELNIGWTAVEVDEGEAERALVSSSILDDPNAVEGLTEELGLTRTGSRVAFVSMLTTGADYNYADREDDPTGLATYPMIRSLPKISARLAGAPVPEPAPKKISDKELLAAKDVPLSQRAKRIVITADGEGRGVKQLSECQKESLTALGATQVKSRNFRFEGNDIPASGDPDLYTATLQFENAGLANEAEREVAGWMNDCRATLQAKDYTVGQPSGDTITSVPIETDTGLGDLYNVIYTEPRANPQEGVFENVGTLVVGDRLVVMVRVYRGYEDYGYYQEEPVDGFQPHPFLAMMKRAATLLS